MSAPSPAQNDAIRKVLANFAASAQQKAAHSQPAKPKPSRRR